MEEVVDKNQVLIEENPVTVIPEVAVVSNSPKKRRINPWIVAGGLVVLVIIAGVLFLIKYYYFGAAVVVNAPSKEVIEEPTPTPVPTVTSGVNYGPPEGVVPLASQSGVILGKPYKNNIAGFQISPPSGWSVDDSGRSKAAVVFMNTKGDKVGDKVYVSYINVTTGVASGVNLQDTVGEAKKGLVTSFKDYVIEEDRDIVMAGQLNHIVGGTYKVDEATIRNRNLLTIFNGKGFAVSITALDSAWQRDSETMNESMFSLRLF